MTTAVTTIVWIAVTFATRPESNETLVAFYRRARPADLGWRRFARETGIRGPNVELARNALAWLLGVVMVYSIMFATGALIFGERQKLVLFGGLLVVSASGLWATLRPGRRGESSIDA